MPPRKPPDPKLEALLQQGTANPRPQSVRDSAFQESEFFDARDLVQVKYEMLRRVRSDGHSVAQAAENFGVSRPTFYKAQTDFERDGLAGLLPAKRGPHGPHKMTTEVFEFITKAQANDLTLDAGALAKLVKAEFGLSLHVRTIERALSHAKKNQ